MLAKEALHFGTVFKLQCADPERARNALDEFSKPVCWYCPDFKLDGGAVAGMEQSGSYGRPAWQTEKPVAGCCFGRAHETCAQAGQFVIKRQSRHMGADDCQTDFGCTDL